jgi:hypothetical protein
VEELRVRKQNFQLIKSLLRIDGELWKKNGWRNINWLNVSDVHPTVCILRYIF